MKTRVMGALLGLLAATGFAAEPAVQAFDGAPLDFVPTPLAESSPTELRSLLEAPIAAPLRFPALRPAAPAPLQHHLTIVEPDPRVRSAMPVVAPDPAVDYKLMIIDPSGVIAGETGK
jgi:hypothetical protein